MDKCHKYEKQTTEWLNMIVAKDFTILHVIVTAKDMISECIRCPQMLIGCPETAEAVRFLDWNMKKEME